MFWSSIQNLLDFKVSNSINISIKNDVLLTLNVFDSDNFKNYNNLVAYNWKSDRLGSSVALSSINVKINYTSSISYLNSFLINDIISNKFNEKLSNSSYIISKNNENSIKDMKKSLNGKLEYFIKLLDSDSLDSDTYNKILNFVTDFENILTKNPNLRKFLNNDNYVLEITNNQFYANGKENIILNNLISLMEDQIKLTNAINEKLINN